jgi:transcriptional regulator with XRE-family HTH domain
MVGPRQPVMSPQARGRELAREGVQLWRDLGSVNAAAAELMSRHQDLPSLQAFRYACGLSQDQAAVRYNEVTGHQTTLGGTTVNAWETWARGRGAGSPPTFSSLLILANAYGRGPLGVAGEPVSPGDLVAEACERLAPEDQLALRDAGRARRVAPAEAGPVEANGHYSAGPPPQETRPLNAVGLVDTRLADVEAIFTSRSEFSMQLPPAAIFEDAKSIRACGLSLNFICQQYADDRLRSLVENGASVQCLFLAPDGASIKAREEEEGYTIGQLSALTALNIEILRQRIKGRLDGDSQSRVEIATYDETVRFNIILVDDLAFVQPYLHSARGLESPTFVIRRQGTGAGLYPVFEETFTRLWERGAKI